MEFFNIANITRKQNLKLDDSLSAYKNYTCQQAYQAYEQIYLLIKEVKPKRILEIGTSLGGLTQFLHHITNDILNIKCNIRSYDIITHPWYNDIIQNNLNIIVEDIFLNNYSDIKQEVKDYISNEGKILVFCDGGNKIKEFNLLSKYLKSNDIILAHDYSLDKNYFEKNINKKVWNWLEIQYSDVADCIKNNNLKPFHYQELMDSCWICMKKS